MKKSSGEIGIKGKVVQYNISPKGMYEGLLIDTKKGRVQVNFPKEEGARISSAYEVGSDIALKAENYEDGKERKGDHNVFSLVCIDSDDQKTQCFSGKIKGKVAALNYALHGEVNGAILETGDFVHMKPEGAKAVSLKIGQTLTVEGELRPSSLPNRIIEASNVNGGDLEHFKKHRKSA